MPYNSYKLAGLLTLACKRDSLIELTTQEGTKQFIQAADIPKTNSIAGISYCSIVSHRLVNNRADSLRLDAADFTEETIYQIDNGIKLKHYEIEPSTGFLRFIAPVSRVGSLRYYDEFGKPYDEVVPAQTLIDSIPSLKGKPITSNHPSEKVTRHNASKYMKGSTHNIAYFSNDWLWCGGSVFDGELINDILNGKKQQISLGYDCLVRKDGDRLIQAKRDVNHQACCERARAGDFCSFKIDTLVLDIDDSEVNRLTPPNELLDYIRV